MGEYACVGDFVTVWLLLSDCDMVDETVAAGVLVLLVDGDILVVPLELSDRDSVGDIDGLTVIDEV